MSRPTRSAAAVSTFAAVAFLMLVAGGRPALSDDTDLLRFTSGKPYVFFLLDTSASMTLTPGGKWVHANGDDPRSKLYQAKQVLYQVFQEVNDIHFGFASMNQDNSAATSKHWLYYFAGTLPGSWPITYPKPDPDGPVQLNADGTVVDDVEGDLMTFGSHLDATGIGGTCASPLKLSTDLEKINRYSKLGASGNGPTVIWIQGGTGNKTYRLTVSRPGNKPDTSPNPNLGQDSMNVRLDLDQISNCTGPVISQSFHTNLDLELWTDFLMLDENAGSVTAPNGSHNGGVDNVAGFWDAQDILNTSTCGSGHPFSGQGWEGNYDGAANLPVPGGVTLNSTFDPRCAVAGNPATCYNLKRTTQFDPLGRPLDRGDIVPLDWRTENKDAFLDRLAPNQSDGAPDFRIATYFKDQPDALTGVLPLATSGRSPLFGTGPTPLGKMVIDFRCFYQGEGNKCNEEAYGTGGWESIAKTRDSEWGCRRPYLIVISDGADSCPGENPCADTANLNSKSSVRTWVIAYGANCQSAGNPLKCMAQNGKGELLCPQTASDLKTELLNILGQIREETRAFASAAVPSIQTTVDQRVFLTDFTPLNNKSVWDGHVDAYLKPVPPIKDPTDLRPDRNKACTASSTEKCHLWDAGDVMRLTQVNAADPVGTAADQRRVYYSRENTTGLYAQARRLLEAPDPSDPNKTTIWRDLLKALEIPFIAGDSASESAAQARANLALQKTYAVKSATITTVDPVTGNPVTKTIQYLLGDIFHSNPLVVGSPPNTKYFTDDLHDYRDFFREHELRRKMLIVGSNDGMLHVFDAGVYRTATTAPAPLPATTPQTPPNKFDNGSGKELFAYAPRTVLPTIRQMAEGTVHQWGVDGTVTVADVFLDPELGIHGGSPDPDLRKWRTVIFGGLREGGSGYYALDITQPDTLDTNDVPQPASGGSGPPFLPSCANGGVDCGPLPFPAVLWEFDDSVRNASGAPVKLDEDANGQPDLGVTWSIPNIGRIRLAEGSSTVEKFVLVAGGGFDPDNKTNPTRGTWLYMIDVETGKVIYKRQLAGAVPSEPAAVDTDQDGFFDRIYIGTTAGKMYRVNLTADAGGGAYPALANKSVRGLDANTYTVQRVPDTSWVPRLLFDANTGLAVGVTRPIFYRPSVIFVPSLGRYALSFGTGDREDLWNETLVEGRFYVFVDDSEDFPTTTVFDETRFQRVTVTSPATSTQFLFSSTAGNRGWYLVLDPDERLITDPFALSGVSFFSTYQPDVIVSGGRDPLCSKTGTSRLFVVSTVNANPFMRDANNIAVRNAVVNDFVTNPFTEDRLLKNASSGTPAGGTSEICDTETMNNLRTALMSLFPVNCRFSNQTIDIKTVSSKTALVCIAPVPVCTIEKNWREN